MISVCIPIMNRLDDLRQTLPTVIRAANNSPPVEIAVLDYNSSDGLERYIKGLAAPQVTYRRYEGRNYFHMAHARNLAMLTGRGIYLLSFCADIKMAPDYITHLRRALPGNMWVRHPDQFVGVVCVDRREFKDAGGYDERFEFYGKEDKDLLGRLERRGKPHTTIPARLELIYTPWDKKLENYRGQPTRGEVSKHSKRIFRENNRLGVLVANEGQEWGQWTR